MRLHGKVAFITGAGMGQGREGALLFAKEGARVAVADVNGDAAAETARLIAQAGGEALAVVGNVGVERDVERMIRETVARFGAPHVPRQPRAGGPASEIGCSVNFCASPEKGLYFGYLPRCIGAGAAG